MLKRWNSICSVSVGRLVRGRFWLFLWAKVGGLRADYELVSSKLPCIDVELLLTYLSLSRFYRAAYQQPATTRRKHQRSTFKQPSKRGSRSTPLNRHRARHRTQITSSTRGPRSAAARAGHLFCVGEYSRRVFCICE